MTNDEIPNDEGMTNSEARKQLSTISATEWQKHIAWGVSFEVALCGLFRMLSLRRRRYIPEPRVAATPRPWALEFNRFAVVVDKNEQLQNSRFGLPSTTLKKRDRRRVNRLHTEEGNNFHGTYDKS